MNRQYFIFNSSKGWDKPLNTIDSLRLNLKLREIQQNPLGVDKHMYLHEFMVTVDLEALCVLNKNGWPSGSKLVPSEDKFRVRS